MDNLDLVEPEFSPVPRTRREAAGKLAEWFGPLAPKEQTLARYAHEGKGPPYVRAGKRAGYFDRQLWQWGIGRLRRAL